MPAWPRPHTYLARIVCLSWSNPLGNEDALDALEQAETDRTIYRNWEVYLPHSSLFSNLRDHPRFAALVERTKLEMARQLAELTDE
jgi:hypothetical protein